MGLIGFGLRLIIFHGVSPRDLLMANCNKITANVIIWAEVLKRNVVVDSTDKK